MKGVSRARRFQTERFRQESALGYRAGCQKKADVAAANRGRGRPALRAENNRGRVAAGLYFPEVHRAGLC